MKKKYNIGDMFVYVADGSIIASKAVVTIIDYVYREYCKDYRYVIEHNYSSSQNNNITTYDVESDYFLLDGAMKHYIYYRVKE